MKLSKEAMTAIILALHEMQRGQYEYGLPVYDDGQMALMREKISETLEGFES